MYVLPGKYWNTEAAHPDQADGGMVRRLIRELGDLRRRVAKGANLEAERMRYSACLTDLEGRLTRLGARSGTVNPEAIERSVQSGRIAGFDLPALYFDLLARAHMERVERQAMLQPDTTTQAGSELGASVFPPGALGAHAAELDRFATSRLLADQPALQQVARARAGLVRAVQRLGSGLVEIAEELDNGDVLPPPPRPEAAERPWTPPAPIEPPQPTGAKGRRKMAERLANSIDAALPVGGKINMQDQPHDINTEVLARFLFAQPGQAAGRIRIVYADGSEAKPFPLRTLAPPAAPAQDGVELSLALMSMRHLELDPFVERAWYRNKEVSQTRPLAESDEFCFRYSLAELEELRRVYEGRPVLLRMYHTGFEPASVGFYRAVVTELQSRRGWLRVLPHYYQGGTRFQTGEVTWE